MIAQQEEDGAMASRGRCEVAVQWERPERREVGVQSRAQSSDAAVQVDLIGLSFAKPGSRDVPWRCVSVRAEEPGGRALWHCCLHSPSAQPRLCPSANGTHADARTPDQEPDSTLETTLPSMQQSSPNPNQSGPSLPSMPICGDSPSSPGPDAVDPPDPAPDASSPAPDATPEAALEALGFMAPLSSDEEDAALAEQDKQPSGAAPLIKRRPGRPKSSTLRQTPPTSHVRRRNINARQAGLPLRYQLDYDLESHERVSANQEAESGGKRDDKKKAPFLPGYKQSMKFEESGEFQDVAQRQYKNEHEDLQINSFDCFKSRPLSPNERRNKPRFVPLKLKKVKNKVSPRKIRDWSIENKAIKEERTDEESLYLANRGWPKGKPRKIKVERWDGMEETRSDWSRFNRIGVKREPDWAKSRKDGVWAKQRSKQREIFADYNAVKLEAGKKQTKRAKRGPGRPRRIEQEHFEVEVETEENFAAETDDERPSSSEHSDRPRRKTVGPPIRYLLESEDLNARKRAGARSFHESLEPGEIPDWYQELKEEEQEDEAEFGATRSNGMVVDLDEGGSEMRLRLGDVGDFGDGEGGLVKKVKILENPESDRRTNGSQSAYEDIQDLFVLRGEDDGEEERTRRTRRRRKRRDDDEAQREIQTDSKRRDGFLVYRDEETGRTTFIAPCFVKLQPLEE